MRRNRWAVLVVAMVLWATAIPPAHACRSATHARRLVLGQSAEGIVVLELDWQRRDQGFERPLRWRGPVRLGLLVGQEPKLQSVRDLAGADEDDMKLELAIARQLRVALLVARSYPRFQMAGMPRYEPCDFEATCGRLRLAVAQPEHPALRIETSSTPVEVPLAIPAGYVDDFGSTPTPSELAVRLRLVSVLSYDVGGREVLVIDLGVGDVDHSTQDAYWPPCGCDRALRCPPVATTMHHGSHFEVVVPLPTPRPPLEKTPVSNLPRLKPAELSRAEGASKQLPLTNGVYATDPACHASRGWSRQFLRFYPDGTVRQTEGNSTPRQAHRLTEKEKDAAHFVTPGGTYTVVGRRLSAAIKENEDNEEPRKWRLDGILDDGGNRAILMKSEGGVPQVFHFTAVR